MVSSKWIFTLALIAAIALTVPDVALAQRGRGSNCPAICPALYSPVCATLRNGQRMQFSNSCESNVAACQRKINIVSTTPGEC